jgi:hypothetical protein
MTPTRLTSRSPPRRCTRPLLIRLHEDDAGTAARARREFAAEAEAEEPVCSRATGGRCGSPRGCRSVACRILDERLDQPSSATEIEAVATS